MISSSGETGEYQLDSTVFDSIIDNQPLKAVYEQNSYKLQYKDAGALEGAQVIAIGEATGYTLDELKTVASRKSNFETVMSQKAEELKGNPGRDFKGWKLGGSTFNLPKVPEKLEEEKEEVDWDNLLKNTVQDETSCVYTITFEAGWAPQKYIIEYQNDQGDPIAVKLVSNEESETVN